MISWQYLDGALSAKFYNFQSSSKRARIWNYNLSVNLQPAVGISSTAWLCWVLFILLFFLPVLFLGLFPVAIFTSLLVRLPLSNSPLDSRSPLLITLLLPFHRCSELASPTLLLKPFLGWFTAQQALQAASHSCYHCLNPVKKLLQNVRGARSQPALQHLEPPSSFLKEFWTSFFHCQPLAGRLNLLNFRVGSQAQSKSLNFCGSEVCELERFGTRSYWNKFWSSFE